MSDAEDASPPEVEPYQTQFDPDGDGELYEVEKILAEKGKKYFVKWAGVDSTGKPWKNSWVFKKDTTDDLIRDWKRKQEENKRRKSGATKARGSSASSKATKRAGSASTTSTTRRTRQSVVDASATSNSTRRLPKASGSRASPVATSREPSPDTRKRRRDTRASLSVEADVSKVEPSRPHKKRKLDAEVGQPRPSEEPQSSYEVVVRKRRGKVAVLQEDEEDEDEEEQEEGVARPGRSRVAESVRAAGKRKVGAIAEPEEQEQEEEPAKYVVPTTKVGPPRHLKRRRKTSHAPPSRNEPISQPPTPHHQPPSKRTARATRVERSPSADDESRPKNDASSRLLNGTKEKAVPKASSSSRRIVNSKPSLLDASSDSDDTDDERASRLYRELVVHSSKPTHLSLSARQLLMQEEEESTQDTAGIVPPVALKSLPSSPFRAVSAEPQSASEDRPEPGPSRRAQRHGRPFANDTFSRLGVVPETQTTGAQELDREPPYDPTQDDLVSEFDMPRTPVRRSEGLTSRPGSVSSVVSKMKSKRKGKLKELRPIPRLSPSDFRQDMPEEDDIEEFSSPEKDARRTKRAVQPFTQDTIEEDFSQDMDNFVDWEGGAQQQHADPSASTGPALSLGPELTPPDAGDGPRKAMEHFLSKEEPRRDAPGSPEVPELQELPPTSTTQQADADSMSQQPSIRSSQIAELNAILEEKDEKLTQLEGQIEELQTRISELENENSEESATFEAELQALRAESGEKTEQITVLESQLVELQLQLTQLTADNENQRARHATQIQALNVSLEERNEQVSQLEDALVELQVEVEAIGAEKEKLEEAQQEQQLGASESDAHYQKQLAALRQRLATLEEELASARQRHEEEIAAVTDRLQRTSQDSERRLKTAEDDRNLFRTLYEEASTHAQRLAKENAELEEGKQRAEERAQAGVAMVKATFTERVKALHAEVERLTTVNKVLTDKDARTNDEVRARAAREPELQEENARLRREHMETRREMEKMAAVISQMPRVGGDANWVEDEGEDDGDYVPGQDEDGSSTSSDSSLSSSDVRASPISSREPVGLSPSLDGETCFVCQFVSDGMMCNETFGTAQAVTGHADSAHYEDVPMLDF